MEVRCHIELRYASKEEAERVLKSVAVDNEGFVKARRLGNSIAADIVAGNPLSLLHTVEDYLACVSVAEKTVKAAGERPRGRAPPRPSRKRASRRGS